MTGKILWTVENIYAESLKYMTRNEFQKGSPGAYGAARRKKILKQVYSHMVSPKIYWTEASIRAEAIKYGSKFEFEKNNKNAYQAACKRNMHNDGITFAHMTDKYVSWTPEKIRAEAKLYPNRKAFANGNKSGYNAAILNNMLNDGITCAHMKFQRLEWDIDKVRAEALLYSTRKEFEKGSPKGYAAARAKNMLDDGITCKHMIDMFTTWSTESIRAEALRYTNKNDFAKKSRKAYQAASHRNMIDDGITCNHMEPQQISWDIDLVRAEALKFSNRTDFSQNSRGYSAAVRMGLLDDGITCSHMEYGITGFNPNKPGILYYIKFESSNFMPIYKIGITNLSATERLQSLYAKEGITATIIKELWFENGKEAYNLEKLLHQEFKEHRYLGDDILGNGNTELYITDVLQYDLQKQSA